MFDWASWRIIKKNCPIKKNKTGVAKNDKMIRR